MSFINLSKESAQTISDKAKAFGATGRKLRSVTLALCDTLMTAGINTPDSIKENLSVQGKGKNAEYPPAWTACYHGLREAMPVTERKLVDADPEKLEGEDKSKRRELKNALSRDIDNIRGAMKRRLADVNATAAQGEDGTGEGEGAQTGARRKLSPEASFEKAIVDLIARAEKLESNKVTFSIPRLIVVLKDAKKVVNTKVTVDS